jgi:chorismate dehydratase
MNHPFEDRIRVGAVAYLNTRPLVHGLEQGLGSHRLELSYDVPSALADRMVAGEFDIGLLPVVELARLPDLEVVPGLGITTRGPSRSVLLVSRVPLGQVRRVALDPHSRTTNALVRVLFARLWEIDARFVMGSERLERSLHEADAAVRIGDKALFDPPGDGFHVHDLAGAWTEWTGLPFVFATWAARPNVVDREIYRILHESRRRGTRALDTIAREYTWNGSTHPGLALEYLTEFIHFRLGALEVDAVKRFLGLASELELIDQAPPIRLALQRWTVCHETALRLGAPDCRLR